VSAQKVYLVGAGPEASLITVRGLEVLRQADVVIYDYLVDERLIENVKEGAELIACGGLGKSKCLGAAPDPQKKINALMVKKAGEGRRVVRLKSGDPAIFSRLSEELDVLSELGIEFEVIPGVSAASAAACLSGISLTGRKTASSLVFVTGHEDDKKGAEAVDWGQVSRCGTIVLYMSAGNIGEIAGKLMKTGKPGNTPVVAVERIGSADGRMVRSTLENIASASSEGGIGSPAVFIMGRSAATGKSSAATVGRALFTGLSEERFFAGRRCFHLPMIRIAPLTDYGELDAHLKNIGNFDRIIFTSRYGARYFFMRLNALGLDSRALRGIGITAIGSSTRKCLQGFGILADMVPERESSEGLLDEFAKMNMRGEKIFLPRSDLSDKGMTERLERMGAEVTACVAYRNMAPSFLPDIDFSVFDEIIFTSPSGVRNFVKRYGNELPVRVRITCIGGVTLREAGKCGLAELED